MITSLLEIGIFIGVLAAICFILFSGAVRNRIKATAMNANERLRDPESDGKVALADAKHELENLRTQRREHLTSIEQFKLERAPLVFEVDKFEKLAQAAGKAGNREDVATAVERKKSAQSQLDHIDEQITEYKKMADDYSATIAQRQREIQDAESNSKLLVSSIKLDHLKEKQAMELSRKEGFAGLATLKNDALKAKARATAAQIASRSDEPSKALEEKYAIPSGTSDEEVNAYMKA